MEPGPQEKAYRARRVLITGVPGVGKSTVCRLVAEGLPRSTAIDADVVRESIVGGFVQPDMEFGEEFVEQVRLQREIVNSWVDRMVDAGYHTVIDDAPIPPPPHFQRHYASLIGDPSSVLVVLTASKESLRSRLHARGGPFDEWALANLDELDRSAQGFSEGDTWSEWTVIDTSDSSPEEVAATILDRF